MAPGVLSPLLPRSPFRRPTRVALAPDRHLHRHNPEFSARFPRHSYWLGAVRKCPLVKGHSERSAPASRTLPAKGHSYPVGLGLPPGWLALSASLRGPGDSPCHANDHYADSHSHRDIRPVHLASPAIFKSLPSRICAPFMPFSITFNSSTAAMNFRCNSAISLIGSMG